MPHTNNKKPRRGNNNHNNTATGRAARQVLDTSFRPFNGTSSSSNQGRGGQGHRAFTLQEEARNTERHHSWDSDQRLRDTRVSFVSAGRLDPTISPESQPELHEPPTSLAQMALDSVAERIIVEEVVEDEVLVEVYENVYEKEEDEEELPEQNSQFGQEQGLESTEQDIFIVDIQGNPPVNTGMPPPRVSSPTPSNSSEEVILFAGRDQNGRGLSKPRQVARIISDPIEARIKKVDEQIQKQEEMLEDILHQKSRTHFKRSSQDTTEVLSTNYEPQMRQQTRRSEFAGLRSRQTTRQIEEDALLADYIANMDSGDGDPESVNRRELGGSGDEISLGMPGASEKLSTWDRDDIDDFDDLSTSDGVMGDVIDILSKRRRAAGMQYLVVWEDQSTDEARWVPMTTLTSNNALLLIGKFEAEESLKAEFRDISDDDSEENSDETDDDEDEISMDGESVPRKQASMSDRQMAILFAKQQQLGIDGDELLLFNSEGYSEDEDPSFPQPLSSYATRSVKGKGKGTASHRARSDFPAASALADAYDGFDVMDFERPSLKKKPKGRKGKLALDLSDSDLLETLNNTYENDRIKKKERKLEREELRALGLLGGKNCKPDMKQKYKEGMSMPEIKEEIKRFLKSDHTTMALPPMEKEERKVVHGIANAFKLKSKSDGAGKKRFPILYKTARTRPYMDGTFDVVAAKGSRQFLPRPDVKHSGRKGAKGFGGFNSASVSYRDGDVVGGSAPELGVENRGRAMLEKMGWSTGTALGALNNKGILQPVTHVVKTSKAGLG